MKTTKRYLFFFFGIVLWSMGHPLAGYGAENLFKTGNTDSAIKPLVFPKSMVVIRSCHPDCLSLESDQKPMAIAPKTTTLRLQRLLILFSKNEEDHRKAVKKWLVRLDPARIAPATRGEDFTETVSRKNLEKLGEKHRSADFLFLFHQALVFNRKPWAIRTRGIIYLTKQDKLIALPFNDQNLGPKNEIEIPIHLGLQQLAKHARKVIHSHKYEKRRSNY